MEAFKAFKESGIVPQAKKEKWVCQICGYVYDGEVPFEQLPEDWTCPICKHPKSDFVKE
jgi:rubredoxin